MPTWARIAPGGLWHIYTNTPGIACDRSVRPREWFGYEEVPPPGAPVCRRCEKLVSPPIPSCELCGRPVPAGQGVVTWRGRVPHGHHAERCLDTELTLGHGEVVMESRA